MKKLHILACCALGMAAALSSCQNEVLDDKIKTESDRQNEYMKAWIAKFDIPDPNHDWCMLRAVEADIEISAIGGASAQIYNRAPQQGGHLIGIADGDTRLVLDLQKNSAEVYAIVFDNDGNEISKGIYDATGESVRIDGNATPVPEGQSRYAHGDENWFDAMIACEDMGAIGDFDFNDVVLGLRHVAGTYQVFVTPMAAGGTLDAKVRFRGYVIGEIHSMLNGEGASTKQMINTTKYNIVGPTISLSVSDFSIANCWQDFSLLITNAGEMSLSTYISANTKEDKGTAPQMLCLGGDWYWPTETTSIDVSYPNFKNWTSDASVTSWCDSNNDINKVVVWDIDKLANWISVTTDDNSDCYARINNNVFYNISVRFPSGNRYYMTPPSSTSGMFSPNNSQHTTSINVGADHFDVSAVTNMNQMFNSLNALQEIEGTGNWQTGNVRDMSLMFQHCRALTTVDVSGWDMKNVVTMENMFFDCNSIDNLDVSHWDFNGNAVNMQNMFCGCSNLSRIDMSGWNIKPYNMKFAFLHCDNLSYLDISNLDLTNLQGFGSNCKCIETLYGIGVETLKMNNWVILAGFDMDQLFSTANFLKDFTLEAKNWDCRARTVYEQRRDYPTMAGWFYSKNMTSMDVTGWLTDGVQTMFQLFGNCQKLQTITGLSGTYHTNGTKAWDVSSVKDFNQMFCLCKSLKTLDLSDWHTTSAIDMYCMFGYCEALEYLYIDNFDMTNVTNSYSMFSGVNSDLKIRCSATTKQWFIDNADTISLPAALRDADSPNWL